VVGLGESVLVLKAAAGLPTLTPLEKRRYKEFYLEIARKEGQEKAATDAPAIDVLDVLDGKEPEHNMLKTEDHVEKLRKYGGGFLERVKEANPNANFDSLQKYVLKSATQGGFGIADVVRMAQLAKAKARESPKMKTRSRLRTVSDT
jgi:hypothetical protein